MVLRWEIEETDADRWHLVIDGIAQSLSAAGSLHLGDDPREMGLGYTPQLPEAHSLSANYPNPFNPSTAIEYRVAADGLVHLRIYDLSGQLVRDLVSAHRMRGRHTVSWDSRDNSGARVASGVYYYTLDVGTQRFSRKMVLLK